MGCLGRRRNFCRFVRFGRLMKTSAVCLGETTDDWTNIGLEKGLEYSY